MALPASFWHEPAPLPPPWTGWPTNPLLSVTAPRDYIRLPKDSPQRVSFIMDGDQPFAAQADVQGQCVYAMLVLWPEDLKGLSAVALPMGWTRLAPSLAALPRETFDGLSDSPVEHDFVIEWRPEHDSRVAVCDHSILKNLHKRDFNKWATLQQRVFHIRERWPQGSTS